MNVLVADIGGSNSRFALAGLAGWPEHILIIENDTVPDLEGAVLRYLDKTGARPQAATFAIAGLIQGEEIALTNRAWRFRRSEFAKRFGFSPFHVVNDFEAVAWALPRLGPPHTRPLGQPMAQREGVKLALGPGTGLGVAALVPLEGRWQAVASEGGHASFGPNDREEDALFAALRERCGSISAETVLSGPGLVRFAGVLDPSGAYETPESIIAEAHRARPTAQRLTRLFVRLLGRFAGDLALTFRALGGIYVTGGVAHGLGTLLDDPVFRAAFEAHPPYEALLQSIPTYLVTCEQPGLVGCATLAQMAAQP